MADESTLMTNTVTRTVDVSRAILQVSEEITADGTKRMNPVITLTVLEDGSCVSSRVNTETLFTEEQNAALYQMFVAMAVKAANDAGFTTT